MKKVTALLCLAAVVLFSNYTYSQNSSLPVPRNIEKAIEKGTRTLNGAPGPNYWQNKSDYTIKVEIEPPTRKISGEEKIVYYNNSPDTLKQIVIRLYQDILRKGNMRDFEVDPSDIHDGVELHNLVVDGKQLKTDGKQEGLSRTGTNLFIKLDKPLAPKSKIEIETSWSFIISKISNIRMGTYDSTSFFVSYFYPQVAVYDDIDGWDTQNYTGQTEMYNDFNNYNVEITTPKNFTLWATGVLQNPEEVFSPKTLEQYKKAHESNDVVRIIEEKDYQAGLVTADKEKLTYKFKAEHVPDFAFATSDHYLWDASTLVVDKETGRKTFISAAYNKNSKDFYGVAELARKAIESFSTHIPGWPFPYPSMTVFNGQGGMEYPMMVNDSSVPELKGTVHLTSHEICHTYFPFFMGINERKYAWMDEGWATMLPFDFQTANAGGYDERAANSDGYSQFAGNEDDIPLIVLSYDLRGAGYRTASYRRPGAAYEFLRQTLGDDLFIKCLHEYMSRWNGKHPEPYDFFFTFNEASGQNLDWYFKPWFFEREYPDLSLSAKKTVSGELNISITNKGGMPVPVLVKFYYDDGTNETVINKTAEVWKDGKIMFSENVNPKKNVKKIELGTAEIPDVDLKNNAAAF